MKDNIKYWELFLKQKAGTLSSIEQNRLEEWKNTDVSNTLLIQEFETLYLQSGEDNDAPDFEPIEQWDELQALIKFDERSNQSGIIKLFPRIARIAAVIILLIGVSSIIYFNLNSDDALNLQTMAISGKVEKKTVELPDGTVVTLNRETELLYPEKFAADSRTVYLKGEAYFDVAHDKTRPFIIHSGITKTTVLGTSFNLRAYSKEDEVKLTVVTGKVAFTLADEKEGVIVTPGNMAKFTTNTKSIMQERNRDINFLSWKTGQLIFDDIRMDSLMISLENFYGTTLNIENPQTRRCRFTGDFQDIELENALKIITRTTGTSYSSVGDSYVITGTGCN